MYKRIKILIAPNAFKESLSALEVSRAIEKGIYKVLPNCKVEKLPLADGGDGTLEVILYNICGFIEKLKVTDPLGMRITAKFCISKDKKTAFIELAKASGLQLVPASLRNPLVSTTYGTGELIKSSLDKGIKNIIIGVGGSATVDGGVGIIQALGGKFLDKTGRPIGRGGQALASLHRIDLSTLDPRISDCKIIAACDVKNKLLGPAGAAATFGPQKGATPEDVQVLENNLSHLTKIVKKDLGIDISRLKGGAAGGGAGAGLAGFLGAEILPGIDVILQLVHFGKKIRYADLVITGEGKFDYTTFAGKAPYKVITIAKRLGIKTALICGSLEQHTRWNRIDFIEEILPKAGSLSNAIKDAKRYVENCAKSVVLKFLNS